MTSVAVAILWGIFFCSIMAVLTGAALSKDNEACQPAKTRRTGPDARTQNIRNK